MASVKFKSNLKKAMKKAENEIVRRNKQIKNPIRMKRLGKIIIKMVRNRTMLNGLGVDKAGGALKKLNRVSIKYAEWRKRARGRGSRSKISIHRKAAKGNESNLTLTGHMIESLDIVKASDGELLIGHDNKFAEDKTKWQKKAGRVYMYLSKSEQKEVTKRFTEIVSKIIKQSTRI